MEITQDVRGFTPEGEAIVLYKLTNASGASVEVTNLGAALVAARVPDRDGVLADVVLGYADWQSYRGDGPFMGKSVGRYANRMGCAPGQASASFALDGAVYTLAPNEKQNQLHGGAATLANKIWEARIEGQLPASRAHGGGAHDAWARKEVNSQSEFNRVVFSVQSPDGEGGYPGNMTVEAAYHWSDECELEIVYSAECDAHTVVNLTNHAYFNLAGEASGSVLGHLLQLNASAFVPTRPDNIPTGEIWQVDGTPMDFRKPKTLGRDIDACYPQLVDAAGYDRCWVIDGWRRNILGEAGWLADPVSGRRMTILTSQPGVQLYTGNWLAGSPPGKSGRGYANRDGVALECQGFPDAPNHPGFPDQTLRPGERYIQKIVYKFDTV